MIEVLHSDPHRLTEARARAYGLFASLVERGLRPELLDAVHAAPSLVAQLANPIDVDAEAADHYDLFELRVHPYQGAFTHPHRELIGQRLASIYAHHGWEPAGDLAADHLAAELRFLAELDSSEAQRDFLAGELLGWLPALRIAVQREPARFYRAALDLLWDVVLDHATALAVGLPAVGQEGDDALEWLDDPQTRLRDIAEFLLTPVRCGLYLSRTAIARVAGELPRGFGSRARELRNVLDGAADFERFGEVVDRLDDEVAAWQTAFCIDSARSHIAAAACAPWLRRLAATTALLARLRAAV